MLLLNSKLYIVSDPPEFMLNTLIQKHWKKLSVVAGLSSILTFGAPDTGVAATTPPETEAVMAEQAEGVKEEPSVEDIIDATTESATSNVNHYYSFSKEAILYDEGGNEHSMRTGTDFWFRQNFFGFYTVMKRITEKVREVDPSFLAEFDFSRVDFSRTFETEEELDEGLRNAEEAVRDMAVLAETYFAEKGYLFYVDVSDNRSYLPRVVFGKVRHKIDSGLDLGTVQPTFREVVIDNAIIPFPGDDSTEFGGLAIENYRSTPNAPDHLIIVSNDTIVNMTRRWKRQYDFSSSTKIEGNVVFEKSPFDALFESTFDTSLGEEAFVKRYATALARDLRRHELAHIEFYHAFSDVNFEAFGRKYGGETKASQEILVHGINEAYAFSQQMFYSENPESVMMWFLETKVTPHYINAYENILQSMAFLFKGSEGQYGVDVPEEFTDPDVNIQDVMTYVERNIGDFNTDFFSDSAVRVVGRIEGVLESFRVQ